MKFQRYVHKKAIRGEWGKPIELELENGEKRKGLEFLTERGATIKIHSLQPQDFDFYRKRGFNEELLNLDELYDSRSALFLWNNILNCFGRIIVPRRINYRNETLHRIAYANLIQEENLIMTGLMGLKDSYLWIKAKPPKGKDYRLYMGKLAENLEQEYKDELTQLKFFRERGL